MLQVLVRRIAFSRRWSITDKIMLLLLFRGPLLSLARRSPFEINAATASVCCLCAFRRVDHVRVNRCQSNKVYFRPQ